ncbi:MAG: PAS domain S-box protein [Chloroflexaceae bacterium]|nr:PAS domain S-box protein [Chloroflexaceae bacterium]
MPSEQTRWQEEIAQLRQQVTDLKQIAENHQRSAEDFQQFFTLSLDMLCIIDFNGFFTRLNPAWEQILGFTLEELLAEPFIERVHSDDRERTIRTMAIAEQATAGKEAIRFENRCCCKDGTYRWLEWQSISLVEEQLFYAVARDITQRKQAEEEVQRLNTETLRRFKSLVENAMDGITMANLDGTFAYANPTYCRMLGYRCEELHGQPSTIVLLDDVQSRQIGQEIASGRTWNGPVTHRRKDGSTFEGHVQSWLLHDETGQPQAAAAVVRDITDQQHHEQSLRQSQALLQSLLDNMPLAVYVKDTEGRYTIINQLAASFIHATPQNVLGKTDYHSFLRRLPGCGCKTTSMF